MKLCHYCEQIKDIQPDENMCDDCYDKIDEDSIPTSEELEIQEIDK